jgi:hypothetical protein
MLILLSYFFIVFLNHVAHPVCAIVRTYHHHHHHPSVGEFLQANLDHFDGRVRVFALLLHSYLLFFISFSLIILVSLVYSFHLFYLGQIVFPFYEMRRKKVACRNTSHCNKVLFLRVVVLQRRFKIPKPFFPLLCLYGRHRVKSCRSV